MGSPLVENESSSMATPGHVGSSFYVDDSGRIRAYTFTHILHMSRVDDVVMSVVGAPPRRPPCRARSATM